MGAITIDQPRKCRSPWSRSVQYRLLAVAKVHWRCLWARRDKCHVNWHKLTVSGARQARWCSDEIGWVGNFDLLSQRFDRGALWHARRGMAPWQRAVSVLRRGHSTPWPRAGSVYRHGKSQLLLHSGVCAGGRSGEDTNVVGMNCNTNSTANNKGSTSLK